MLLYSFLITSSSLCLETTFCRYFMSQLFGIISGNLFQQLFAWSASHCNLFYFYFCMQMLNCKWPLLVNQSLRGVGNCKKLTPRWPRIKSEKSSAQRIPKPNTALKKNVLMESIHRIWVTCHPSKWQLK